MARFLVRRLALLILGLLGASLVIFAVLRVLPGDVATLIGGTKATPEQIAAIRAGLGLDRSLPSQFFPVVRHEASSVHEDIRRLEIIATEIAPEFGWRPA